MAANIRGPEPEALNALNDNGTSDIELPALNQGQPCAPTEEEDANEHLKDSNNLLISEGEELRRMNDQLKVAKQQLLETNEELRRLNEELNERNDRLDLSQLYSQTLIRTVHEPLLVLGQDFRVKSANPSFHQFFGFQEADINGRVVFELLEGNCNGTEFRDMFSRLQSGEIKQVEAEVKLNLPVTGERILKVNASLVSGNDSAALFLIALEDITLIKQEAELRESGAKLELALQVIEDFFAKAPALFCILKGPEHVFEFVNQRYNQVSGGTGLKGKRFIDAFPEFENEGYKKILDDVYRTGIPFSGKEMKATHFPGSRYTDAIYVDLSCQVLRNDLGGTEGVLFFSYEVTEQVLNRLEVEKNASQLEGKITERTMLLQEANNSLEISNKNLDEFASIASHDLQEPLRKIKTFTSILKDRYFENLPPQAVDLILKTYKSANRMSSLIKDVLNYSRVATLLNNLKPTDLNVILNNVISDFDLLLEEKKATINLHRVLPVIEAFPLQMNQLFYNLVGNALKFSSKNEPPVIDIYSGLINDQEKSEYPELLKEKSYCRICVRDNGIGFAPEYAEQIFSVFERLHTAEEYEGTGIGLALCRKIVTAHHGLIRAESEEGKGTTFCIILPYEQ